jgi:muramoyltetrapeptide carboxypeptidase
MTTQQLFDLKPLTVGLISPSSPPSEQRVLATVDFFQKMGWNVKLGSHHDKKNRFLAGTDRQRAEDIERHMSDAEVEILLVTGGGSGSLRVLPYLDVNKMTGSLKPIIGFSDTTCLQLGLYAKIGLLSITGLTCRDLTEGHKIDPTIEETLVATLLQQSYTIKGAQTLRTGHAYGCLIGGNLSCLCALMGTPFQPDFRNHILILEDLLLEPYVIDMLLAQLYVAGVFSVVSGVVFGQFYECHAQHHAERDGTVLQVLQDWADKMTVPVVYNFAYGHGPSRHLWPIGAQAHLDASKGWLEVLY